MKSFTLIAVLAVLLVCAFQQTHGWSLGNLEHDIGRTADKVVSETGNGIKNAANGVANGVDSAVHGVGHALSSPTMQKVDKVANEVEPVAKVVATGIAIGEEV